MRTLFLISIFAFSSLLCKGQLQSMMFEKTWGVDSPMYNNAILYVDQQPNGDYFMIGNKTVGFWGMYQHYACRTDSTGAMLWEKRWGVWDARCGFSKAIKCANGTYMAVGSALSGMGGGIADMTVANIDADGNILFCRYYDFSYDDRGYDIMPTYDSGYVISGVRVLGTGNAYPAYVKIDGAGNEVWRRTQSSLTNYWPAASSQTSDNGFVVLGVTSMYSNCLRTCRKRMCCLTEQCLRIYGSCCHNA